MSKYLITEIVEILFFLNLFIFFILLIQNILRNSFNFYIQSRKKKYKVILYDTVSRDKEIHVKLFGRRLWGDKQVIEKLLLDLLEVFQGDVKKQVVRCLYDLGRIKKIIRLINSERPKTQIHGIEKFSKIGFRFSIKPIVKKLKSDNALVRIAAIKALAHCRHFESLPKILKILPKHTNYHLLSSLLKFGSALDPIIIKTLKQENDIPITSNLIILAGERKNIEINHLLVKIMPKVPTWFKCYILNVMAQFKMPIGVELIKKYLNSPDKKIRYFCEDALFKMKQMPLLKATQI